MAGFDEAQHPRAGDGKFADGAGAKRTARQKVATSRSAAKATAAQTVARIGARQSVGGKFEYNAKSAKAAAEIKAGYQHFADKNYGAARTAFEKHKHVPTPDVVSRMAQVGYSVRGATAPMTKPAPTPMAPIAAPKTARATPATAHNVHRPDHHPIGTEGVAAHLAFAADHSRRLIIGQGRTGPVTHTPYGSARQFSDHAQAAIRDHHNTVIAQYGLHNLDASKAAGRRVSVDEDMKIGGHQCYGSHSQGGDVELWGGVADHLARHAQLDPKSLTAVGQRAMSGDKDAIRMVDAYRVSTHEALHGHGAPDVVQMAGTMTDEITTEVVARRIVGDLHGIAPHQVPGSYDRMIHPVVEAAAAATGRSFSETWAAVERASMDFKKRADFADISGQVAVHFAGTILKHLGNNDPTAHAAFAEQYRRIGKSDYQMSVSDKYPSVNRYL